MLRRLLLSSGALIVIVGLAVGLSLISPLRRPPAQTVDLVHSSRITCLTAGRALALGDAPISASALGEQPAAGVQGPLDIAITEPTVLSSNNLMVAGVLGASPMGWTPCTAPLPTGVLQVLDPADSELVFVNTDANEAVVDLTLLGADGEISAVGARGIAIAPGVSRTVALSVLAPEGPVGVLYDTSEGRVSALVRPVQGRTAPNVVTATAEESRLIGGIPGDAQRIQLVLSNPSEDRVDVSVAALGATSSYEPAPAADLTIAPLTTLVVDLGTSLGGEAAALSVTAPRPIAASIVLGEQGTQTLLRAAEAAERLGVPIVDAGSVLLTNPGVEPVDATVLAGGSREAVTIQAGTTTVVAVTATEPGSVTVEADAPVIAVARAVDGTVSYPLAPTEVDSATAGVVRMDPTLR